MDGLNALVAVVAAAVLLDRLLDLVGRARPTSPAVYQLVDDEPEPEPAGPRVLVTRWQLAPERDDVYCNSTRFVRGPVTLRGSVEFVVMPDPENPLCLNERGGLGIEPVVSFVPVSPSPARPAGPASRSR